MERQYAFWLPVTVRWADMDSLGHVNNAKYFTYLESARTAFFDAVTLWRFREHPRQGAPPTPAIAAQRLVPSATAHAALETPAATGWL